MTARYTYVTGRWFTDRTVSRKAILSATATTANGELTIRVPVGKNRAMKEGEAAKKLADATLRWFVAGRARDDLIRKQQASALAAITNGGKQDHHREESEFFFNEYKAAEKAVHEALANYARVSPESIPRYPHIALTAEQEASIKTMDWIATMTDGAMKL